MHTGAEKWTRFTDVASRAGLSYAWTLPSRQPRNILETIGNGCGLLDFDNDGNLDVLLVGRAPALFKGDGKGQFANVTQAAGLSGSRGHFLGCATGDYDGDGFTDLYLSGYRTGVLLHNEQGRFRDVTSESGLKAQPWGSSCAFLETVPGSGRLDLYVANYVTFGSGPEPQLCEEQGIRTSCGPRSYIPEKGVLYLNEGKGRFVDATARSGADSATGKALGVACADFDSSGRPSIALANDEIDGDLLHPQRRPGDPTTQRPAFQNIAARAGVAYDRDGNVHGGMGLDWGDFDNDGRLDLLVGTYQYEAYSLYKNLGKGHFSDQAWLKSLAGPASNRTAFGLRFFDYDNDGWLDFIVANGHTQDNIQQIRQNVSFRQATHLYHNTGTRGLTFEDVSDANPDLKRPILGRGLAVGDYDNDGRVDALVVDSDGRPLLLHNDCPEPAHWLGVRLIGRKSNSQGIGALITVKAGGRSILRHCHTDGSYLSASDPRVHFGLGDAARVESMAIRWPSGSVSSLKQVPVDRYVTVKE